MTQTRMNWIPPIVRSRLGWSKDEGGKEGRFAVAGHEFEVRATGDVALSGRPLWAVRCVTCDAIMTGSTTSPPAMMAAHLNDTDAPDTLSVPEAPPAPADPSLRGRVALCFRPGTKEFTGFAVTLGPGNGTVKVNVDGTLAPKGSRIEDDLFFLTEASGADLLRSFNHVAKGYWQSVDGGRVSVSVHVEHRYNRAQHDPNQAMSIEEIPA